MGIVQEKSLCDFLQVCLPESHLFHLQDQGLNSVKMPQSMHLEM